MNWPMVPFGEIAEFRNGLNYTRSNYGNGLKVINVGNFGDRFFPDYETLGEINPDGVAEECDLLQPRDLLFVRSNGNRELIGRVMYVDQLPAPIAFSAFCIRARVVSERAVPKFIAYFFRSGVVRRVLSAVGGGANIANLNQTILNNFPIPLPDELSQQSIVERLDDFESMLTNCQQRVLLLERAARLIFTEWFVRLRFSGNGLIGGMAGAPYGWASVPFAEAVFINPKTPFDADKEAPFVPMTALSEQGMVIEGVERRTIGGGAKFQNGDTLLARITPCLENGKTGFVQFLDEDEPVASGSTEFIVFRSRRVNPYWIYCLARTDHFREFAIRSMSGADGRQRVSTESLAQYPVLLPPESVLADFSRIVGPMFEEIQILTKQSAELRQARDLLLPRLISGQLRV